MIEDNFKETIQKLENKSVETLDQEIECNLEDINMNNIIRQDLNNEIRELRNELSKYYDLNNQNNSDIENLEELKNES
jgi:hypothetical protein